MRFFNRKRENRQQWAKPVQTDFDGPQLNPVPVPEMVTMENPETYFLQCLNQQDILEGEAVPLHLYQLTFVVAHLLQRIEALEANNGRSDSHYNGSSR